MMNAKEWVGVASSAVVILGALFAFVRWLLQKNFEVKEKQLEVKEKQLEAAHAQRKAEYEVEYAQRKAEYEVKEKQLQAEHAKREAEYARQQLTEYRERVPSTDTVSAAERMLEEIHTSLGYVMQRLGATESSVLVKPVPTSEDFIFVSIHGKAAPQMRMTKVGPQSIAAKVFETGEPVILSDPHRDANWSPEVDKKSGHSTLQLLCVPLRYGPGGVVVGVAQFLNKRGNEPFTKEDEHLALNEAAPIGLKTGELLKNPKNLEPLGFYAQLLPQEATLLFCDLSRSSSLFGVVDAKTAIGCMDEYLQRQTDIVYRSGGTIDKYLGDGAMFRFNVPLPVGDGHVIRAAETALKMQGNFENLKDSWIEKGWEVTPIHSRIGIACGDIYEVAMGHGTLRALAVMGRPIGRAAHLCGGAPRDRNVIWIDEDTHKRLDENFVVRPASDPEKKLRLTAYELVERR
jgi:class 3 adenylate cyclase